MRDHNQLAPPGFGYGSASLCSQALGIEPPVQHLVQHDLSLDVPLLSHIRGTGGVGPHARLFCLRAVLLSHLDRNKASKSVNLSTFLCWTAALHTIPMPRLAGACFTKAWVEESNYQERDTLPL